jgi:antitoxin component YwqK of YwqJK toxin-antitoxin module
MTTLNDYKSPEKDILLNVLKEYSNKGIHLLDSLNISSIIENLIYEEVEEYHSNDTLKSKYTLRFGKKVGLYQGWWRNGPKYEECHFRDGKLNGLFKAWFYNGQKRLECTYRSGSPAKDSNYDGLYQEWFENGQKRIECNYINGKLVGLFQQWNYYGRLLKECHYTGARDPLNDQKV